MTSPGTKRSPSIDLLRVLVVVLVVYRHTFPAGDDQLLLATVSVPFFFFLTGWLWRPGRRSVGSELGNRWQTLGRPYVSWLVILYAVWAPLYTVQNGISVGALAGPLIGGEWATRPFTTFWFLSALFLVAVSMRLLDRVPRMGLSLIAVACLALGGFFGDQLAAIPLGAGVAVPALGFALVARILRESLPRSSGRVVLCAAIAVPVLVALSLPLGHIDMKYGIFGTPVLSGLVAAGFAWASIVLLDALFSRMTFGTRAMGWLSALTRVAIIPVLLHPVVLWAFDAPQAGAPFWVFVAAVVLPWLLALVVARTPAAPWLVGQARA